MKEPNFRAEANRLVGCKGMEPEAFRDEILFTLMEIYNQALTIEKVTHDI